MLIATIRVDRFVGVETHEREVMGEVMECVSIPMRLNNIKRVTKKSIVLNLLVTPRKPNQYRETHYLSVDFNLTDENEKYTFNLLKRLGFWDSLKFIGKMMFFGKKPDFTRDFKRKTSLDEALNTDG